MDDEFFDEGYTVMLLNVSEWCVLFHKLLNYLARVGIIRSLRRQKDRDNNGMVSYTTNFPTHSILLF